MSFFHHQTHIISLHKFLSILTVFCTFNLSLSNLKKVPLNNAVQSSARLTPLKIYNM